MASPEIKQSINFDSSQYFSSNPPPHDILELFVLFSPAADIDDMRFDPTGKTVLPEGYFGIINPAKLFREITIALPDAPFLGMFIDNEAGELSKTGVEALEKLRQQTPAKRDGVSARAMHYLKEEGFQALINANITIGRAVAKRLDEINPQLNPNQS